MPEGQVERKLAAIVSADVAGYSRLMEADEEGTLKSLSASRELMDGLVARHRGRVFGSAGDSIIAEFASPVEAVRCAVAFQDALAELNAKLGEAQRMRFRIGVNLGDVMVQDENLLGDGVNIAARLEALADAGGVCISGTVHDQVKNKLDLGYDDLGPQTVKKIAEPVPAYRVRLDAAAAKPSPAVEVPDKPSIAVLPFANMGGDPEQDYFADGITEDLITELSRFHGLFVIARNSVFSYKGKSPKVQDVGAELGVRYILEGSVRRAGERVRITAQLIDAATGHHLWAERYDRKLASDVFVDDVFGVQDEVTQKIVATLPRRLEAADLERARRKPTANMAAYDYLLQGKDHHHRGTKVDIAKGLKALGKAIELDPNYAQAYAWLACTISRGFVRGYFERSEELMSQVIESIHKAHSLDAEDPECHWLLCEVHLLKREFDKAEFHQERALALNPNDPRLVVQRGFLLAWLGRGEDGVEWVERAMRLDPNLPEDYYRNLGLLLHEARRYAEAVDALKRMPAPQVPQRAHLASCYGWMGARDEARAEAAKIIELTPEFSAAEHVSGLPYKNETDREHHRVGLVKAGLPD